MPERVVDYLVRAVADRGIGQIFGVDGANIEDLYDAIFDAGGRPAGIIAKHEFSAATMADGYARSTGGLGVVAATSGGGALNLVAGLAESFTSRVPVLALVGQPPTTLDGLGAFQDSSGLAESLDAAALFATVSRYCARVTDPAEVPGQFADAVAAAERGGPAVLLLPKDIQQQAMPEWCATGRVDPGRAGDAHTMAAPRPDSRGLPSAAATPQVDRPDELAEPPADPTETAELTELTAELAAARRTGKVVVIAGDQVARDNARTELATLVAALDASIGVAPDAKDVYADTGPGFCGVAGSMGHADLREALESASACLLVGTRLPVTARAGLDHALAGLPLLSVGALPPYLPATHATSTDLATALTVLRSEHPGVGQGYTSEPRNTDLATFLARQPEQPTVGQGSAHPEPHNTDLTFMSVPAADGPGLRYRTVVEAIQRELPDGADIFADAGNTGASVVHYLRVPEGGRFVVALGMGGMGYAFGAGIGSAFARGAANRTVVIAGDGSFFMHGMEIHTAVEYDLPITFVVFNNNAHAMCVTREQIYYRDRYSFNRFRPTHLGAGIAAMFPGLPAYTVDDPAELDTTLGHCLTTDGPSFVEILCDPDEIPPFLPFLS
ncbi:thiamine pyrophosphate-binding protein [Nocardia caishijiensis]|uniref:acetolactate synthase n=1 Tax=Nocardia caishijiensis TaxID=184756 RepID=A0ABQ6YU53_9NOCA|nr:thiamine pyrophosphate-binding protein [Nocardia caishijiensis]KAF0849344.1 acetolactate synthase-1/2/3 large subunit [Nocardia caishijiensis]